MEAHQQMDCGTFVLESEGVRWMDDLGSDDYSLPGFWDYKPGGQRWNYFRNNNFSHNTIHIDHQLQYANGEAFVCEEQPDAKQPFARFNMTSLYKNEVKETFRKFTLLDDHTIEVEDEVELLNPQSVVYWRVVTRTAVEVKGNRAVMHCKGKRFYLEIVSPAGAEFRTEQAKNSYAGEKPITGTTILEAACKLHSGKGKIVVRLSSKRL